MFDSGSAQTGLSLGRGLVESGIVLGVALLVAMLVVMLSGLETRYQVVLMIAVLGMAMLALSPDRRILTLALWVLVQPLSVEKVFYTGVSIEKGFIQQAIVINAADLLLVLLGLFLLLEWAGKGKGSFAWSPACTLWSLFIGWAAVSFAIHAVYLSDGLVKSAPLALLHYARVLLFMVLVNSAIRNRGDLIIIVLAIAAAVLYQAVVVGLSYATGERFSYAKFAVPTLQLPTFTGEAGMLRRATGTVGHTNQQAFFHTFYTLPLIALFALRNRLFRSSALLVVGASILAILVTFSRSAWLSFPLALLLVILIFLRQRLVTRRAWLVIASMLVMAAAVLAILSEPVVQRLTKGDEGATASRLRMLAVSMDLFMLHPVLGVGPGEFAEAAVRMTPAHYKEGEWVEPGARPMVPTVGRLEVARFVIPDQGDVSIPLPAHNKYILTLSELGLPGLLLFLAFFGVFVRAAWRCAHARDTFYRYLGIASLGTLFASAIYMSLDLFDDDKTMQILLFVPLLAMAASRHIARRAPGQSPSRHLAGDPDPSGWRSPADGVAAGWASR